MKHLITLILLALPLAAHATVLSNSALNTLMTANPIAIQKMEPTLNKSVTELLSGIMTSQFDYRGVGTLSIIQNTCGAIAGSTNLSCRVSVTNSDRVRDIRGAYVPATGMTESGLVIDYQIDATGTKIQGNVTYFFAG